MPQTTFYTIAEYWDSLAIRLDIVKTQFPVENFSENSTYRKTIAAIETLLATNEKDSYPSLVGLLNNINAPLTKLDSEASLTLARVYLGHLQEWENIKEQDQKTKEYKARQPIFIEALTTLQNIEGYVTALKTAICQREEKNNREARDKHKNSLVKLSIQNADPIADPIEALHSLGNLIEHKATNVTKAALNKITDKLSTNKSPVENSEETKQVIEASATTVNLIILNRSIKQTHPAIAANLKNSTCKETDIIASCEDVIQASEILLEKLKTELTAAQGETTIIESEKTSLVVEKAYFETAQKTLFTDFSKEQHNENGFLKMPLETFKLLLTKLVVTRKKNAELLKGYDYAIKYPNWNYGWSWVTSAFNKQVADRCKARAEQIATTILQKETKLKTHKATVAAKQQTHDQLQEDIEKLTELKTSYAEHTQTATAKEDTTETNKNTQTSSTEQDNSSTENTISEQQAKEDGSLTTKKSASLLQAGSTGQALSPMAAQTISESKNNSLSTTNSISKALPASAQIRSLKELGDYLIKQISTFIESTKEALESTAGLHFSFFDLPSKARTPTKAATAATKTMAPQNTTAKTAESQNTEAKPDIKPEPLSFLEELNRFSM